MKRILCGILALLAVFICAACSAAMQAPSAQDPGTVPNTAPQSTAAAGSGPVTVTETHANSDAVPVRPAPSAAPAAAPDTPATGEVPVVPLVGALGLILLCSAGLVMLKRF